MLPTTANVPKRPDSVITWEEPPQHAGKRPRKDWQAVAQALRSRPGSWAVIDADCPPSQAGGFNAGRNRAFPAGEFEFRSSGVRDGRAEKLYGRYVGTEATS